MESGDNRRVWKSLISASHAWRKAAGQDRPMNWHRRHDGDRTGLMEREEADSDGSERWK